MKKKRVYFRVDGGLQIGLGHLVRCIALAQMLQTDFEIFFVCIEIPDSIKLEIKKLGFNLLVINDEGDFLSELKNDTIVVLDHYGLDSNYQKSIKAKGCKLVCIDDLHDKYFYADLIINTSPAARENNYNAEPYTRFALGLNYALLRPAFLASSGIKKSTPVQNELFLCLGGSDSNNKTMEVLETLKDKFQGNLNLVVGASYPFISLLQSYLEQHYPDGRAALYCDIDEYKMVDLMRKCSIAICSPSSVSIEYLAVTRGLLFMLLTANNQKYWYNYALSNKLAFQFSEQCFNNLSVLNVNYTLLDELFDGNQTKRLLQLFS